MCQDRATGETGETRHRSGQSRPTSRGLQWPISGFDGSNAGLLLASRAPQQPLLSLRSNRFRQAQQRHRPMSGQRMRSAGGDNFAAGLRPASRAPQRPPLSPAAGSAGSAAAAFAGLSSGSGPCPGSTVGRCMRWHARWTSAGFTDSAAAVSVVNTQPALRAPQRPLSPGSAEATAHARAASINGAGWHAAPVNH